MQGTRKNLSILKDCAIKDDNTRGPVYFLAFLGTLMIGALIIIVNQYNYGVLFKSDFVIRFLYQKDSDDASYLAVFETFTRSNNLLHVEPSWDPDLIRLTFDISVKEDSKPADFVRPSMI